MGIFKVIMRFGLLREISYHDIFYGLHSAITRQDKNSQPEGGWYKEQAVNIDEAVRAYTSWSAFANFTEDYTGIIDEGRWADITIMNIDPFVLSEDSPVDIFLFLFYLNLVSPHLYG